MRSTLLMVLSVLTFATIALPDAEEELGKLKEQFKKRHPTLTRLKDEGRVGEVHDGYAAAVKLEFLEEKTGPAADSPTIRTFLAEENGDRSHLYALLADEEDLTPEIYADRAAKRNFSRAEPEHWLKPKNREWIRKKDLDKEGS